MRFWKMKRHPNDTLQLILWLRNYFHLEHPFINEDLWPCKGIRDDKHYPIFGCYGRKGLIKIKEIWI